MNIEEKLHALQNELEDAKMELNRVNILHIRLFFVLEFKYSVKML